MRSTDSSITGLPENVEVPPEAAPPSDSVLGSANGEQFSQLSSIYPALLNSMSEGFALHEIVCDQQGRPSDYRFLEINPAFEKLTGLKRAKLIGKLQSEVLPREDPHWLKVFCEVAQTGKALHFQHYSIVLRRHYEVDAYCPEPGKFAVLFLDVTERVAREKELHRLNRTLKALGNSAQAMMHAESEDQYLKAVCRIIVEDCGHAMVWVGFAEDDEAKGIRPVAYSGFEEGYLESLQLTWDDRERGRGPTGTAIRERRVSICRDVLTDPRMAPWREQAVRRGYASSIALPLIHAGSAFGALMIYSREPDPFSGSEVDLLSQLADDFAYGICALRLRAEHVRTQDALRKAKEDAEAANKAKDDFLAVLSHELRTPLTPVLAAAQMMQRSSALDGSMKEIAGMIRRNVELEARLIDDLLDLTRISRGKLELHLQPADLHQTVFNVLEMCAAALKDREIKLNLELKASLYTVRADTARLQQILWNLLSNAVKFAGAGGKITVHSENVPPGRISLKVKDDGVGIDPEVLPKLFSAFEQGGRHVTRQFGGLGLGLAISKSLAEMQGGSLSASSPGKGQGAEFTLVLDAVADFTAEGDTHEVPEDRQPDPASPKSILLVEDNADTALMVATLFEESGFRVLTANSVSTALKFVHSAEVDLVISDLGLPDGSGYELMGEILKSKPLPAIAVSGFGMEDDVRKSLAAGFLEHVTKPVDFTALEAVVKKILARGGRAVDGRAPVKLKSGATRVPA